MNTKPTFPCVPTGPAWSLDFDAIVRRFPILQELATCEQEPEWHAEGDVLTHTRMVLEQLCAMPEWRELPDGEREVVFGATLFHDIAKPRQTRVEEGRIRSKGHARQGALLARQICMTEIPEMPFAAREMMVGMVRYHGLPAYFLDRAEPERAMLTASLLCRMDLLCILATADARGRITRGRDDMPDRVALFRDFAEEHGCLRAPYAFAGDHSRVHYFRNPGTMPTIQLFDDSRCTVTLLSGLPAAGKDTWVRKHAGERPVISLDQWREDLDVEPGGDQSAVILAAKDEARGYLRQRRDFIWNATNTSRMLRDSLTSLFFDYHARLRVVYCEAPLPQMRERNARRARPVPVEVVDRLMGKLEVPDLTEAHQVEYAVS